MVVMRYGAAGWVGSGEVVRLAGVARVLLRNLSDKCLSGPDGEQTGSRVTNEAGIRTTLPPISQIHYT
jgi:hypothetical protein